MKRAFIYIVFIITSFYFFAGTTVYLLSKLGSQVHTEILDISDDVPDSEGKEGKDTKEDGSDEESYTEMLNRALTGSYYPLNEHGFHDLHLFISSHILEQNAPPPRA